MLYDYKCSNGHTVERLVRMANRDDAATCHCGQPLTRVISAPHCLPDGVYSYMPNVGSANAFERRQQAIKDGVKVIPKILD